MSGFSRREPTKFADTRTPQEDIEAPGHNSQLRFLISFRLSRTHGFPGPKPRRYLPLLFMPVGQFSECGIVMQIAPRPFFPLPSTDKAVSIGAELGESYYKSAK